MGSKIKKMLFNLTYKELKSAERSVFSQGGQDGVLEAIFNQIGHGGKLFFDIGARDGVELSNTANLRMGYGWNGLLLDVTPLHENVTGAMVTKDNINEMWLLVNKNNINEISLIDDADLLNCDIDGNDFWIWEALQSQPKVVCIEYNSKFRNDESYTIAYNPDHKWEGDDYYGASLLALKKLGEKKGYTLVYVVDRFDAVFVRNDLVAPRYKPPTLDELLPEPIIAHEKKSDKKWDFV